MDTAYFEYSADETDLNSEESSVAWAKANKKSGWMEIAEAPTYEVNEEGQVRNKFSGRCLKRRDDGMLDDPYVILRIDGQNVRRSIYVLARQAMVTRRQ
jgi:hypothetical protein